MLLCSTRVLLGKVRILAISISPAVTQVRLLYVRYSTSLVLVGKVPNLYICRDFRHYLNLPHAWPQLSFRLRGLTS